MMSSVREQWRQHRPLAGGHKEHFSVGQGHIPPPSIPHVVGCQSAGEIVAIGSEVTDRSVGQKVVTIVVAAGYCESERVPWSRVTLVRGVARPNENVRNSRSGEMGQNPVC